MCVKELPTRVARVGGSVERFDTHRRAYKSVATEDDGHVVATLLIPPETPVVYPAKPDHAWNSNKLRTRAATVLDIADGSRRAVGPHSRSFVYEVGSTVEAENSASGDAATTGESGSDEPVNFNSDPLSATGGGLYCFATRRGADNWGRESCARPWDPES